MSGSCYSDNGTAPRKRGPQRSLPKITLLLLLATHLVEIVTAQGEYSIPVYPSRKRYEEDTYFKVRQGLDSGDRQGLIDLINTDPLVCRAALIRLLGTPDSLGLARQFASLFRLGSTSPIEEPLVEFFAFAPAETRLLLLDSFETLIDLESALRRAHLPFDDHLSRKIKAQAPGLVDEIAESFGSIGFSQGRAFCLYFKAKHVFALNFEWAGRPAGLMRVPILLEEARSIFQEHNNVLGEFNCLIQESDYHFASRRREAANESLERCARLAQSKGEDYLQLHVQWNLGLTTAQDEKPSWEGLEQLPGLPYFKSRVLLRLSDQDESHLETLHALISQLKDPVLLTRIHWLVFQHFQFRPDKDPRSIDAAKRAIELARTLDYDITAFDDPGGKLDPPVPAVSYMIKELAEALVSQGDFEGALEAGQLGLRSLEAEQDLWSRDQLHSFKTIFQRTLVDVYRNLGDYDLALQVSHQMAEILDGLEERNRSWGNYRAMAIMYSTLGNFHRAEEVLKRSVQIPNRRFNGAKIDLAKLNLDFRRYDEALRWLEDAEEDLEEASKKVARPEPNGLTYWRVHRLEYLANIWLRLGNPEEALEVAQILEHDPFGRWVNQGVLGTVLAEMGQYGEATTYFEERLKTSGNREWRIEVDALRNLGQIQRVRGVPEEAIPFLEKALARIRQVGRENPKVRIRPVLEEEQELLQELALAKMEAGDRAAARKLFGETLRLAESLLESRGIWTARFGLGQIAEAEGDRVAAIDHYRAAVAAVESITSHLKVKLHKVSFLEDKTRIYDRLIGLLGPSQPHEAFHYAEKRRAQTYLDSIRSRDLRLPVPGRLLREKEKIEARLIGKQSELRDQLLRPASRRNDELITRLQEKLAEVRGEHSAILRSLQLEAGAEAYRRGIISPLRVEGVQARVLRPGQVLVEYVASEEALYAFVIDQSQCRFYQLPLERSELAGQIDELLRPFRQLREGRVDLLHLDFDVELAHRIYEGIFEPIESALEEGAELIVVADDVLHYLAFESLTRSSQRGPMNRRLRHGEYANVDWLLRHYTFCYAISATSLDPRLRRSDRTPSTLLAFAEPLLERTNEKRERVAFRGSKLPFPTSLSPLPRAVEEVGSIGQLMRDKVEVIILRGGEASERAFLERASESGYLHFAVHAFPDDRAPEYSTLVLSEDERSDGFLQSYEILQTNLNSRLVVLSGCDTALGRLYKGEGLLGLKRAFLVAGARSVLVSLWGLEDSTADFMEGFYRLLAQDVPLPTAVRKAKLEYLGKTRELGEEVSLSLSHPFFWAPLTLTVTSDY